MKKVVFLLSLIMAVMFSSCVDITNEFPEDGGSAWTECELLQAQLTVDIQAALDQSGVIQDVNDPNFDAQLYIDVSEELRTQYILDRQALGCD